MEVLHRHDYTEVPVGSVRTDLYCDVSFCNFPHVEPNCRNHVLIELPTLQRGGRKGGRERKREGIIQKKRQRL